MPSGSISHQPERPDVNKRHAQQTGNAENSQDNSYERVIIHATAAPFIMFPVAAMLDSELSHRDKCVLMAMCWHANQRHLLWCKQETLATELNLPISKISESIAQLIAHGYVEIVRKAYRGAENAALRTNKYRIIWQADKGEPDPDELPPTHISRSGKSIFPATGNHISRSGKQNRTIEQNQKEHSSSEVSFNSTSLAHSAENRADATPAGVLAPPERRTRERLNVSALKRDPLVITLIACFGVEPATPHEWDSWRIAVNDLHAAGVTSNDIPRAIKGYQALHPNGRITPLALARNWSQIREGKSHDLAQLEIAQRAHSAAVSERRERDAADAERKAQERAEVERLLSEYGYADGGGHPARR